MKKIMLLMIFYVWWHNASAQYQAGLEQYYYMDNKAVIIAPIAWYQANNGWYAEGRYNYEAEKTLSIYCGKTFEKKSTFSYTASPLIGLVMGNFKGISVAVNAEVEYKKLNLSLQSQYTFSFAEQCDNFLYNWCDLSYRLSHWLSAGFSLQYTALRRYSECDKGIFIKAEHGAWAFPLYIFNTAKKESNVIMGLNFTWQHIKKPGRVNNISRKSRVKK